MGDLDDNRQQAGRARHRLSTSPSRCRIRGQVIGCSAQFSPRFGAPAAIRGAEGDCDAPQYLRTPYRLLAVCRVWVVGPSATIWIAPDDLRAWRIDAAAPCRRAHRGRSRLSSQRLPSHRDSALRASLIHVHAVAILRFVFIAMPASRSRGRGDLPGIGCACSFRHRACRREIHRRATAPTPAVCRLINADAAAAPHALLPTSARRPASSAKTRPCRRGRARLVSALI